VNIFIEIKHIIIFTIQKKAKKMGVFYKFQFDFNLFLHIIFISINLYIQDNASF